MKARKLPSGNWRCLAPLGKGADGKYKYKSFTAKTKKEAEYMAAEFMGKKSGNYDSKMTVGEAIEEYIKFHKAVSSPSTVAGWRKDQRNYFDAVNHITVASFDTKQAQRFVSGLADRGLSPKTIRNAYGLLSAAVRYQDPDKTLRPILPQKKNYQQKPPTDAEVKQLIAEANGDLKKAIVLAAVGTLRRSEVCGLEFSDVEGNFIHVQRVVVLDENKNWITKNVPKTSASERWVEYPPEVIELLGTGEGRIIQKTPDQISGGFRRLKNRLGITCRFHDLRGYAASIMHALGIPDEYVLKRGGWKNDTVLKSVYRNILEDKLSHFIDLSNEYAVTHILERG